MSGDFLILAESPLEHPDSESQAAQDPQADYRAHLLAQFEKWMDQMLLDEPIPSGLPEHMLGEAVADAGNKPTSEADLYSLFSALTGLTGEIRLQGRAFKQLTDLLSPLSQTPAILEQLREAQLASAESVQSLLDKKTNDSDALPVQFSQVCNVMIDLHDRLERGLRTCDEGIQAMQTRRKSGWLQRILTGSNVSDSAILSVQAIRDAGALTVARLAAALQEWGVQRIGRVGEPFDPDTMSAVEVRSDPQATPGTVLRVQRSGYAINNAIKATAQVTVAKTDV